MNPLEELTKKDIQHIKLIVFDVDGVLVPRGTKINQVGNKMTLETKKINERQIEQIKKLNKLGFKIDINSGRGLYMLQKMFRDVLPFVSLTYENGSATWFKGKISQNVNSFNELNDVFDKLGKIKNKEIKGFEPKEFIITIHCSSLNPLRVTISSIINILVLPSALTSSYLSNWFLVISFILNLH